MREEMSQLTLDIREGRKEMSRLRSTVVCGFSDKPIRLMEDLMLAKPRLRSVINSLTFIVTRTIRHKGKENEVFSRIIRTPFDVLLTFVSTKQKSLHYLSFRQTVAHQEGNLVSTEVEKPHVLLLKSS